MSILIVDDYEGVRLTLEATLRRAGYTDVLTADSALDAFGKLDLDDPSAIVPPVDLVLMDIAMPGIDGVEACRRLKADSRSRDIPVIMVTAFADVNRLESALAYGAVDYITKPPNMTELLARVASALEAKWETDRRKSAYFNSLEEKNQELELAFSELEKKNRELELASLAKTQILSTASHELKTPLTSIMGFVDRILLRQNTIGPLNERQQRYLEPVQRNAYRLRSLVDDLLAISRIEAGNLELAVTDLDVAQGIEDAFQSIEPEFKEKGIQLSRNISPGISPINADQLRFSQVVCNLLSNAFKYSPTGSEVTVAARQEGNTVRIDVSDTGIGISRDDQAKLFTKFFRAGNSSTRSASGTGLGLFITKHLIEAHGGQIWVDSEENKGSTFSCIWPGADVGALEQDSATQLESIVRP